LFSAPETTVLAKSLDHSGVLEALHGEHIVAYGGTPSSSWALLVEEPWESVATPLFNTTLFTVCFIQESVRLLYKNILIQSDLNAELFRKRIRQPLARNL